MHTFGERNSARLDWRKADRLVRTILVPSSIFLPAKLWEWSVSDTMKAITAQQEAAQKWITSAIYQRSTDELERSRLIGLLNTDPTADNWLHRQFRKYYQRGHTFVNNQIVYQNAGYSCKRLTRNTVELKIAGLSKCQRITLKLKCRHILSGQIRLIRNCWGQLEVHCIRKRIVTKRVTNPCCAIALDKGYTEAFYTDSGVKIAEGLGQMMTEKTKRITRTNRNRYRLRSYAANNPDKALMENILLVVALTKPLKFGIYLLEH